MLQKLKKLIFKTPNKPKKTIEYNKDIIERIYSILYIQNLPNLLLNPAYKILLLNVYHENFEYFINNILSSNLPSNLIAVNIDKYFINKDNIQNSLKRAITLLSKQKVENKIILEFNEILNTLEYIVQKEEKNGRK